MNLYRLLRPLLFQLAPETAHGVTLWALEKGAPGGPVRHGGRSRPEVPRLALRLWQRDFTSPIGLAAGFDKDARVMGPMLRLGFGFVEVGSVTPRPQAGNPRPRLFRLEEDRGVINRLGFNNGGMAAAQARLAAWRRAQGRGAAAEGLVGVNIGKNKDSEDAAADYAKAAAALAPLADYVTVNVSSPNTPGLRALQDRAALEALIAAVRAALADSCEIPPPLLVKIAPDLTDAEALEIAGCAVELGLQGLIVSNTTVARPAGLKSRHRTEPGGLSGAPLFEPSTALLRAIYRGTEGAIPLIGVGGVMDGADAYAKIRAGASLVQLYSGLIYGGPGLVRAINRDLAALLARDGFASPLEAVGRDA